MRAIILAAGRGSRMEGLTDDRPKCLVEIFGKELLCWQIEALTQAGISEIAIVTGYKRELLTGRGLVEFLNPRWAETNMVYSLFRAAAWLESGPCIVSYSDIFYSHQAVRLLMESDASLALTYDPNWLEQWTRRFGDPLLDAETFQMNHDGTLSDIGNKPRTVGEVQGQYMGLLRFTPEGWGMLTRLRSRLPYEVSDRMHMTGSLNMLIQNGARIDAIPYTGFWGEIDTPTDLAVHLAVHRHGL